MVAVAALAGRPSPAAAGHRARPDVSRRARSGSTRRLLAGAPADERQAVASAAARGFAWRSGGVVPRTTSIAVPVRHRGGTLLCVSMAFIQASTALDEMAAEHLPTLRDIAGWTERRIAAPTDR